MVGMKEKLGPKYDAWYERHRVVENLRVWKLQMEENPMHSIPLYERVMPETYRLDEAFYHPNDCRCGSCDGDMGRMCKILHATQFKKVPWVRGALSQLPEVPHQIQLLLQDVEAEVRSRPDPTP